MAGKAPFRTGALLSRSPVKLSPISDPRYICLYCRNNRLRHSFRPVSEINTLLPAYMLNLFLYIVALLSIAAVLIAAHPALLAVWIFLIAIYIAITVLSSLFRDIPPSI